MLLVVVSAVAAVYPRHSQPACRCRSCGLALVTPPPCRCCQPRSRSCSHCCCHQLPLSHHRRRSQSQRPQSTSRLPDPHQQSLYSSSIHSKVSLKAQPPNSHRAAVFVSVLPMVFLATSSKVPQQRGATGDLIVEEAFCFFDCIYRITGARKC